MPKKTKREKLIAEYRRKIEVLGQSPIEHESHEKIASVSPISQTTYSLAATHPSVSSASSSSLSINVDEFTAIRQDLIRTLIIVSIFLSVEIALWQFLK